MVAFACIMIFVAPIVAVANEQQPVNTGETYTEKLPCTTSVPVEYEVVEARYYNWFWMAGSDIWVTIRNTDTAGGEFSVKFDLYTATEKYIPRTASGYIDAGQEGEIMVKIDGDHVTYLKYTVTPPVKDVTGYTEIVKTKEADSAQSGVKRVTVFQYLTERR